MKLTILLLTAGLLHASANTSGQTVTVTGKNLKLEQVFSIVKEQTGFVVFATMDVLKEAKPVSVEVNQMPVSDFMNLTLKDQGLTYEISNQTILVSKKVAVVADLSPRLTLDAPPVKGVIRDAEGNPLPGINVVIKGTKRGVVSDAYGNFNIDANINEVLIVSSVSYGTKEIKIISSSAPIVVALEKSISQLDEVQYIAYGTQTKRFSVGNVATVKAEDIEKQPVQNPILALQGRVPGLFITQGTGIANGYVKIEIQGRNSIVGKNEPLIVINGIPYPAYLPNDIQSPIAGSNIGVPGGNGGGSPLSYVNPADIESISILKDADATAIYGSRAGNGAILITTKKGKAGKTKLDLNLQQGWGKVAGKAEMMNRRQYLDMRYEALRNDNIDLNTVSPISSAYWDLKVWDTTRETDWQKELIGHTAQYTTVNGSVSGGNSFIQYMLGLNYNRTTDVFPGDFKDQRGSVHFNVSSLSANQKFRIRLSGSFMSDENDLPGVDLTQKALQFEPVAPALYNSDGTLNWAQNINGNSTWDNPLVNTRYTSFEHTAKNLFANAELIYTVLPGFDLKVTAGYSDLRANAFRSVLQEAYKPEFRATSLRLGAYTLRNITTWIAEPQLNYKKTQGRLTVDLLAGATVQKNSNDYFSLEGFGFSSDLLVRNIGSAASVQAVSGNVKYSYNAVFGRFNGIWNGKYVASATWRRDGSSRFGDKNKFHNFWSAGLGWIFTEELFAKDNLSFLSFGKLRGSYGITGHDQIGDYLHLSSYGSLSSSIPYQGIGSLATVGLSNPYLQWEEVRKWQGGIDLGFLKDRISANITYALNRCSNQLLDYDLPVITGFPSIAKNFPATVQNTSWEFIITTENVKSEIFNWTTSINVTVPKNKLLAFPNIEQTSYGSPTSGLVVGKPLGLMSVFRYMGVDPETGLYLVADNEGRPTSTPDRAIDKKTILVSAQPEYYGGIQNSLSCKGFQLEFLLQFVRQNGPSLLSYSNGTLQPGRFFRMLSNQPVAVLDRWQKPGENSPVAKFSSGFATVIDYLGESDAFYSYDASYIRLKNVSFSWQLPAGWIKEVHLQNALLYFQGQNLLTITKYSGLDPETQSISTLPPLQMWTVGCRIGF